MACYLGQETHVAANEMCQWNDVIKSVDLLCSSLSRIRWHDTIVKWPFENLMLVPLNGSIRLCADDVML